jgi:hypothetical protein
MSDWTLLTVLVAGIRDRWRLLRDSDDAGQVSTEQVIWIALGAALAITVLGVIALKVKAKAEGITLE